MNSSMIYSNMQSPEGERGTISKKRRIEEISNSNNEAVEERSVRL